MWTTSRVATNTDIREGDSIDNNALRHEVHVELLAWAHVVRVVRRTKKHLHVTFEGARVGKQTKVRPFIRVQMGTSSNLLPSKYYFTSEIGFKIVAL